MTIALAVKVNDGVVLSSDSASSIITEEGGVVQVYNNADKIFNLHKGAPIGIVTFGIGGLGQASISTLAKDFRARISVSPGPQSTGISLDNYVLEEVLTSFRDFIYQENYLPAYGDLERPPDLGFLMAGNSSGSQLAELWEIEIDNGQCSGPARVLPDEESGIAARGQPDPIIRLLAGFDERAWAPLLSDAGLDDKVINAILQSARERLIAPVVHSAMPIQDAIDLAQMLAELAIDFHKFAFGPPTVGGPVEVAAITKHEGFKWVERKHYFTAQLNPP